MSATHPAETPAVAVDFGALLSGADAAAAPASALEKAIENSAGETTSETVQTFQFRSLLSARPRRTRRVRRRAQASRTPANTSMPAEIAASDHHSGRLA